MSEKHIPVYGTPDGAAADPLVPVYGTPPAPGFAGHDLSGQHSLVPHLLAPDADGPADRSASGPDEARGYLEVLLERLGRRSRALVRSLTGDDASPTAHNGVDWCDYPGTTRGDIPAALSDLEQAELIDRNERVLDRLRRALTEEFGVHWYSNTDTEALDTETNEWGGASLLETWTSATWRTTSGLTSTEDRWLAGAIVSAALRHEGFDEPELERTEDVLFLAAGENRRSDTVLTLEIGFSELELLLLSCGTLALDRRDELRRRATRYRMATPPD